MCAPAWRSGPLTRCESWREGWAKRRRRPCSQHRWVRTRSRLFLKIYGDSRDADWKQLQIRYTPVEIGRLSLFLPRVIEGVSAIDKLNEADLLAYRDDDHIHMHPKKARSFYQYLRELYSIAIAG